MCKQQTYILIGGIVIFSFLSGVMLQKRNDHQALQSALIQNYQLIEKIAQHTSKLSAEEYTQQLSNLKSENRSLQMRLEFLEEKLRFSGHADIGKSKFKTLKDVRPKVKRNVSKKYKRQYSFETANSIQYGKENAEVTITAFYDFTCPFCAKVHPTLLEVAKIYPEDVKIAFKQFPLIPSSYPSAKMILAADAQGKYIEMMDYMFEHMKEVKDLRNPEEIKIFVSKAEFLNAEKFMEDLLKRDKEWSKIIQSNVAEAKKNEISGTPSIFINGKPTQGRNLANFRTQINEILDNQPQKLSQINDGGNESSIK